MNDEGRTNNYAEAHHHKVAGELGMAHPNIWRFIDSMKLGQKNLRYPEHPFNVPTSSVVEQLNLVVNKTLENENEDWEPTSFDFLINGVLLRTDLLEFVESHGLSSESVIKVECILQELAPEPDKDLPENDWVADLRANAKFLFSVNYSGEISIWNLAKGTKLVTKQIDADPLKCIDFLEIDSEQYVVVGAQNQALTLLKICEEVVGKGSTVELTPSIIFRGHQRSVECVAANSDATRIVSGSFDQCLKVWNTRKDDEENTYMPLNNETAKKAKPETVTKTPMVTLEAHREAVTGAKWNPINEKQVVTVSWDHSMIVWDLELAGPVGTMNSNKSFTSVSLNHSSGMAITGSADPVIRLWDVRSKEGSMVKQSFLGHQGWISDLNVDVRSPRAPLYNLIGHEDRVLTVDWSNPEVIASGAADSTIKTFKRS
uniref:NLE domain-containing protein n=1 Tax=Ditylenchus dipsaci TaxID=166011 RepID=A0A915EPH9_9BILA